MPKKKEEREGIAVPVSGIFIISIKDISKPIAWREEKKNYTRKKQKASSIFRHSEKVISGRGEKIGKKKREKKGHAERFFHVVVS